MHIRYYTIHIQCLYTHIYKCMRTYFIIESYKYESRITNLNPLQFGNRMSKMIMMMLIAISDEWKGIRGSTI
jgi:hypothetical protein